MHMNKFEQTGILPMNKNFVNAISGLQNIIYNCFLVALHQLLHLILAGVYVMMTAKGFFLLLLKASETITQNQLC